MRLNKLIAIGLLIFAWGLFGCQTRGETTRYQDPVEQLKARANEYWGYKVEHDFEKAFVYEDPETIEGINLTDYIRSVGPAVQWLGAEVESVRIDGDKARVFVKMRYIWAFIPNPPEEGFVSTFSDWWRLKDGVWYHVFRRPLGFKSKTVKDK